MTETLQTLPENEELFGSISSPISAQLTRRIACALLIAVPCAAVPLMLAGKWFPSTILAFTELLFLASYLAAREDRNELAGWLILAPLTACVAILIVAGKGPVDEAMLALPGLMIFASLLGSRRVYIGLLSFIVVLVAGMALAHFQEWRIVPAPVRADTFLTVLVILTVTSYFIWLMASALRGALHNLHVENRRVRQSLVHIEMLAHHDSLTGLPNRSLARDRFEQAAAQADRYQSGAAVLYLDLDHFKAVNDSLGHASGDALLCDVAARLTSAVRAHDTVSRQGGDEFLIVLGDVADEAAVAAIALKLVRKMSVPFRIGNESLSATCSVGIAMYPENGTDFETLLKCADQAMYQAKDYGRNAFRFFEEKSNVSTAERLHLLTALKSAITNHELVLLYQAQIDLATWRVIGAEALIRWQHPAMGLVSPAQFLPLAERSGLIAEIGAWVFQEACRQASEWRQRVEPSLTVSVNISPAQLRHEGFEAMVRKALADAQLPAYCICLELTESLLLADSQALLDMLDRLRALGLRLSVDDFGSGYSNLGDLKRMKLGQLKIGPRFVKQLQDHPEDTGLVQAMVQIIHGLGMDSVAVGIEDPATLNRLISMGCGYGQGHHWCPALPAVEFLNYFTQSITQPASASGQSRM